MYYVYILECADGSLYTGSTNNLERRFREHVSGKGGHYTSSHQVQKIVYTETHPTRSSALRREAEIKKLTRSGKKKIIEK